MLDDWYLYRKGKAFTGFLQSINQGFGEYAKKTIIQYKYSKHN